MKIYGPKLEPCWKLGHENRWALKPENFAESEHYKIPILDISSKIIDLRLQPYLSGANESTSATNNLDSQQDILCKPLACQYHPCWCPGSLHHQIINRHDNN